MEPTKRLPILESTAKKLYGLSGNLCAMPKCNTILIDEEGTHIGKMAHIRAANKGGQRFDENKTNEENRDISNLFVICSNCHDIIDSPEKAKKYTVECLTTIKKKHELKLTKAKANFIEKFTDHAAANEPSLPVKLAKLSEIPYYSEMNNNQFEVQGIKDFVLKIREISLAHREFVLSIARKMKRKEVEFLLATEIISTFGLSGEEFMKAYDILHENNILYEISEEGTNRHEIHLCRREVDCCPWTEIIEFCEYYKIDENTFIKDLNFKQYD